MSLPCSTASSSALPTSVTESSQELTAVTGFHEARARQIFTMELEFVQCLANPDYLQWLAKNRYFEQPAFINYLRYLQYWKKPQYATSLLFPQCLRILDALQDAAFRKKLVLNEAITELKRQQSHQWIYFDRNAGDVETMFHYQI